MELLLQAHNAHRSWVLPVADTLACHAQSAPSAASEDEGMETVEMLLQAYFMLLDATCNRLQTLKARPSMRSTQAVSQKRHLQSPATACNHQQTLKAPAAAHCVGVALCVPGFVPRHTSCCWATLAPAHRPPWRGTTARAEQASCSISKAGTEPQLLSEATATSGSIAVEQAHNLANPHRVHLHA
jgi:hypothetical protein